MRVCLLYVCLFNCSLVRLIGCAFVRLYLVRCLVVCFPCVRLVVVCLAVVCKLLARLCVCLFVRLLLARSFACCFFVSLCVCPSAKSEPR